MWRQILVPKHLLDFKSRATRREFVALILLWFFSWILPFSIANAMTGGNPPEWLFGVGGVWILASLVAVIAAGFRRLHDQGNSGAFLLLGLVPLVGWIFLLIMMLYPGQPYENEYGPNPRDPTPDENDDLETVFS